MRKTNFNLTKVSGGGGRKTKCFKESLYRTSKEQVKYGLLYFYVKIRRS